MSSPFVRRRRLGAELRALRLSRNLTTEQLGALFHRSRMKISRLENAQVRPDLAEVMDLLDLLEPTEEKRAQILRIAREAAARGWWDAYGVAMGDRQRLYADLESGAATIREYHYGSMPGLMQLPEFTRALIEREQAEHQITYIPERMIEARLRRQATVFRENGPSYEVIVDEIGLRRFNIPAHLMARQLKHIVGLSHQHARLTVRVLPFRTGRTRIPWPMRQIKLLTFIDPADTAMAVSETTSADVMYTDPAEVAHHVHRYETVRDEALSEVASLAMLEEIADHISHETGTHG
ncbi:helix-turn-helix domain-containing protein [Actinocorallia populi]|uniref:helix-turn-helix domain-containing protein n=1 Tax=Actinocorallia populi TaxID=2079200 RepID=UPI000D08B604|nr:helix-turn-helix transcriptional regulator [Actinocorallia populi]